MSRTRTQTTVQAVTNVSGNLSCVSTAGGSVTIDGLIWPPGYKSISITFSGARFTGRSSTMTDDFGSSPLNLLPYRAVNHSVNEYRDLATPIDITWKHDNYRTFTFKGNWNVNSTSNTEAPVILSLAQLRAQAIGSLRPGDIAPQLDLPLFIAELRDFSGLFKSLGRLLVSKNVDRALNRLVKNNLFIPWGNDVPKGAINRTARTVDSLVGADLTWKFAIEPLINEGGKLLSLLNKVHTSYMELARQDAKPVFLRGRATAEGSLNRTISARWANTGWTRTLRRDVVAWSALSLDFTQMNEWAYRRGLLGITPRLQTGWELVPLSFVIDWFVDVGRWLSQFDGTSLSVPYKVLAQGTSSKETIETVFQTRVLNGTSVINSGSASAVCEGRRIQSSYIRTPGAYAFEFELQPVNISVPNLGQIGTLTELIWSAFRGSNR